MVSKKPVRIVVDKELIEIAADIVEEMFTKLDPKRRLGKKARKVFMHLAASKTVVAEETIGRDLGLKSNEARRILQVLSEEAFITYKKTRTGDRTLHGWIINYEQLESILIGRLRKTLDKLRARLEYESQGVLYVCPREGIRYTLDQAIENDFICPRCGALLEEYDNTAAVEFLREQINRIENALRRIGAL